MEDVASLSQGRTAAAHCGLFTYKSVPVIFELPRMLFSNPVSFTRYLDLRKIRQVQISHDYLQ